MSLRCLYVDLDATLLGRGASLLHDGDGEFSLLGARALQACDRAGAEVVIYSGRRQSSVFEAARLIGSRAYIFEAGCGLVLDGELEWLTGDLIPEPDGRTIFDQIALSGAPALLLERFAGRLEYHEPWHLGREVSHLFRGRVDPLAAEAALRERGLDLRLLDNGTLPRDSPSLPGVHPLRAYHLVPAPASKARAVARHMRARDYAPEECIAVGDSREDLGAAEAVGAFWLVANALQRDPTLREAIARHTNVRVAEGAFGAGVYEAVVRTLTDG